MCGICGIISRGPISVDAILPMVKSLAHRGPDAQNYFLNDDQRVALGHTRLSIIDLSEQANQPMYSGDGRFVVVFNGEIYNFKKLRSEIEAENPKVQFRTSSDTEIILAAFACWGVEMVHRLEGMFAIAIYDTVRNKVFLFRDRLGKKPIYYFCNNEHFIFASEIKALLKHKSVSANKEIDKQAVHGFLHLGYIPEPKTIYRAIRKFPSGSTGEVCNMLSFSIKPYWKLEDEVGNVKIKTDLEWKEMLRSGLGEAVSKRLVSDVPLGVFLSGGTDSSLITAIAKEHKSGPLKTFSIGFKEDRFDEHVYASQVAAHLKTEHHEHILYESEAASMLETYLKHLDEPFADTSTIPTMLVSQMAKKQVSVALTGDGGDELFLGYGSYAWAQRLRNPLFRLSKSTLAPTLRTLGNSRYKRIARILENVDKSHLRSHIFSQEQYFFSDGEIRKKLLKSTLDYESFLYSDPIAFESQSEEEKQALFDLKYYLKDDLLVKVDRSSMFYGLECRCPFLDQHVLNIALNAPLQLKRRNGVNKWILKELLGDYIPESLVNRPKWGFSVPLSRWLKNDFRYLVTEYLNRDVVAAAGIVNFEYVESLWSDFMAGNEYLYNRIWILAVLHKWIKDNG